METTELLKQAREFALLAHRDQRYGNNPYEYHLQAVVNVLMRFGVRNATLLAGAWLHDTLEDTTLTRNEIETQFGKEVAELVWRVSDEPGATRKERKPATYLKIRESEIAIILKLADRIANVEESLTNNARLLAIYQQEYAEFKQALWIASTNNLVTEMWHHLDQLLTYTDE